MHKPYSIYLLVTICLFIGGCHTSKNAFYSYEVNLFATDSAKHLVSPTRLISYGDYVLEFKIRTNYIDDVYMKSGTTKSSVTYDTIGVYLLSAMRQTYYEFDAFTLNSKIQKKGKIADKEFGMNFNTASSDSNRNNRSETKEILSTPIDTLINNINCYYSEIISANKKANDTLEKKFFLIKNENFNSPYKINGIKFNDKNYCIVGISFYDRIRKEGITEEIDKLRPLTKKEKDICESIVIKSKQ